MTLKNKLMALPFAHYLGIAHAETPKDDERKQREDESDEDYEKRMEEMDEEKRKEDEAKKAEDEKRDDEKAKKAEDDEESKKAKKAEDEKRDDEKAKKAEDDEESKKAKKAEEEEDKEKASRQSERIRCARILAEGIKSNAVHQACSFAFDTDMTADQAVAVIKASALDGQKTTAAKNHQSIDDRMAALNTPNPGANGGGTPAGKSNSQSMADQIVAVGEKLLPKKS